MLTSNNQCSLYFLQQPVFDSTQPAQQTRPTTASVARTNKKCLTAHNWAEAPYWAQCYSLNNWISHLCKFLVFIGHFWCKIHWILQARATNTILYDCVPVILFLYSERIQHRSKTVVWVTGVQGCEPPPWQNKCKNWTPILVIFRYSVLFWFSVIRCDFAFFESSWTVILQWFQASVQYIEIHIRLHFNF